MSNKKILLIGGHDEFVLHAAVRAIGMKIGNAIVVFDNNKFKPEPIVYNAPQCVPRLIDKTVIQSGWQSRRERRKQECKNK